eukprot:190529_1
MFLWKIYIPCHLILHSHARSSIKMEQQTSTVKNGNEHWTWLLFGLVPICVVFHVRYIPRCLLLLFKKDNTLSKMKQIKLRFKLTELIFSLFILFVTSFCLYGLLAINSNLQNRDINETIKCDITFKIADVLLFALYAIEIFNDIYLQFKMKWYMWIHHMVSCSTMILVFTTATSNIFYSRLWSLLFVFGETFPNIMLDVSSLYYYCGDHMGIKVLLYRISGFLYLIFIIFQVGAIFLVFSNQTLTQITTMIVLQCGILPAQFYVLPNVKSILKHVCRSSA